MHNFERVVLISQSADNLNTVNPTSTYDYTHTHKHTNTRTYIYVKQYQTHFIRILFPMKNYKRTSIIIIKLKFFLIITLTSILLYKLSLIVA